MTDDDDQKLLFTSHMPVTHLYLGDETSESIMSRISKQCPRLIELIVATYGSGPIDRFLISVAKGCSRLSAVGLGNCEITYVYKYNIHISLPFNIEISLKRIRKFLLLS